MKIARWSETAVQGDEWPTRYETVTGIMVTVRRGSSRAAVADLLNVLE